MNRPHCLWIGHRSRNLSLSVLALFTTLISSGCVAAPPKTSQTNTNSTAADSPVQQADFPSPGPFKNTLLDGVELRSARFPEGQFGGTLVKSIVGANPHTFNYWQANDTSSRELAALMFVGLIDTDPNSGEVVPALAESFSVAPDKVTYTIKLRKGLQWSDGKPITADDVVYTWNTIIAGGYDNSSLRDITQVDGKSPTVTRLDDLTVKFVTPKPFVPFLKTLGLPIAPRHVFEPITSQKDGRSKFGQIWSTEAKPGDFVTSGMFTLASYVPSQRVEFVATKNFFVANSKGKRLPYLQRITYLFVPDPNTNLLKFKGKEIDLTVVRARDAGDLSGLAKASNFKLYDFGPSQSSTFVCFNMNRSKNSKTGKPIVDPIKSAWFNDTNFRQAVSHAMDRQAVVDNYFKGLGAPTFSPFVSTSPFYNSSLKPYKRDLEAAKQWLAKSGFKTDKDGSLIDKDGHKVEFDLLAASGSTFGEFFCGSFKENMKDLGIKVNTQFIDFNVLADRISQTGDWQAIFFSLSGGDPLEPNDSANVYRSDGRLHLYDQRFPDSSGQVIVKDARPWEKRTDELMSLGAVTFDTAERKKIYDEVQQILYDEMPMIYVATNKYIVATRNTLHNFCPTPLSQQSNGLHNLEEIWVK